jgi:hypothetical protein
LNSKDKITWITCPDCGSKIGIVLSVGKATKVVHREEEGEWPPEQEKDLRNKLEESGVDLTLVKLEETEDMLTLTPLEFLGDRWGPINDSIRILGGIWIRDGRNSHWEIQKEQES